MGLSIDFHPSSTISVSDVSLCALLSDLHAFCSFRVREELPLFINKLGNCVVKCLECAASIIQENINDIGENGCLACNSIFDGWDLVIASFRSLAYSPLFIKLGDQIAIDDALYNTIIQTIERLLSILAKLYVKSSECIRSLQSEIVSPDLPASEFPCQNPIPVEGKVRIMDMELDVCEDSKNVDVIAVSGTIASSVSFSSGKWKLDMISLISSFFPVLPAVTWEILFDLMRKETEPKVYLEIIYICWMS